MAEQFLLDDEQAQSVELLKTAAEKLRDAGERQRLLNVAFQLADDHELVASTLLTEKALEARQNGDMASEEQYLTVAEQFSRRIRRDDPRFASQICGIAKAYAESHNTDQAHELFREAATAARRIRLPGSKAEVLLKTAAGFRDIGDQLTARLVLDDVDEIMASPGLGAITRYSIIKNMIATGYVGRAMHEAESVTDDVDLGEFTKALIASGHSDEAYDLASRIQNSFARIGFGKLLATLPSANEEHIAALISKDDGSLEADAADIGEVAVNLVLSGKSMFAESLLQRGKVTEPYLVIKVVEALLAKKELRVAMRLASGLSEFGRTLAIPTFVQLGHVDEAFSLLKGMGPFDQTQGLKEIASELPKTDESTDLEADRESRKKIIDMVRLIKDPYFRVSAFADIGLVLAQQKATDDVGEIIRELDHMKEALPHNVSARADIPLARAQLLAATGNQEDARMALDEAVSVAERMSNGGNQAEILSESAVVYQDIGDTGRAQDIARHVVTLMPEDLSQSTLVKIVKNIVNSGAATTALQLEPRIETTHDKVEIYEEMVAVGAIREALQLIEPLNNLDTSFQARIVTTLVASGHPREAIDFAKEKCENDFSRLELVRTLLVTDREQEVLQAATELSFTFPENRARIIHEAAAAACSPELIGDLVSLLNIGELTDTDVTQMIGMLIKLDYPEEAMLIVNQITTSYDLAQAGMMFADKGDVDEALEIVDKVSEQDHRLAIYKSLSLRKMRQDLSAYFSLDEQFQSKYRNDAIDLEAVQTYYTQTQEVPEESMIEDVLYATNDPQAVERFLALFPEDQRVQLRARYQRFSGNALARVYDGVLPEALRAFLSRSDIDFHRLASEWLTASPDMTEIQMKNIEETAALESVRPGIVSTLYRENHLSNIGRYPQEVLLDMYDNRAIKRPYVLMVLTKYDHNGAFYRDTESSAELYKKLAGRYALVIMEAGSRLGVTRRIVEAYRRYGKSSGRIWGAHGRKEGMFFGPDVVDEKTNSVVSRNGITIGDLDSDATKVLNAHAYEPGSPELFISCSTGAEGGFAEKSFQKSGAMRTAPKEDAGRAFITPRFDDDGKLIVFDAEYVGSKTAQFGKP